MKLQRGNCKLQNANCKLQIGEGRVLRFCVSSICNLQFLICNLQCLAFLITVLCLTSTIAAQEPPTPPSDLVVSDHPWDGGTAIDVSFALSPDDQPPAAGSPSGGLDYIVERAGEYGGLYQEVARVRPTERDFRRRRMKVTVDQNVRGEPYWFRVAAVGPGEAQSSFIGSPADAPVRSQRQSFDGGRGWLAVISLIVCGSVILFIVMARRGRPLNIRKIAGLEAVEEAVGRATEMGRSCLFIPGIQDMNDIQTIAGLTVLSRVARRAAEFDARIEIPTSRSLVMTAARDTVQSAFLTAGRPDAFNEDMIYYVTDEQFGYVAYLSGMMVREKPAACFYMGSFFAESLILAETGNAIGAIQVAGTAQPAQLPFFVAACDYTLIGEEFFAASAYLSHDPNQLGSLKGQDVGKLVVAGLMILGIGLTTAAGIAELYEWEVASQLEIAAEYVRETILGSG